jgi:putative SOS response-associated peptidase YedK
MCGRFTLKTPAETVAVLFPGLTTPATSPSYNIAPTQQVIAVRSEKTGDPEVVNFRWGLIPSWAADTKIGATMINARSETARSKPSFRSAFKRRRCLVFADGYYEWQRLGAKKQPHYITNPDNQIGFCMAGLWERWTDKSTGTNVESCTILTTPANNRLAPIHDRMPVVLNGDCFDCWLDPDFQDYEYLQSLLVPAAEDMFQAIPIGTLVNNPRNNSPDCIKPLH